MRVPRSINFPPPPPPASDSANPASPHPRPLLQILQSLPVRLPVLVVQKPRAVAHQFRHVVFHRGLGKLAAAQAILRDALRREHELAPRGVVLLHDSVLPNGADDVSAAIYAGRAVFA